MPIQNSIIPANIWCHIRHPFSKKLCNFKRCFFPLCSKSRLLTSFVKIGQECVKWVGHTQTHTYTEIHTDMKTHTNGIVVSKA